MYKDLQSAVTNFITQSLQQGIIFLVVRVAHCVVELITQMTCAALDPIAIEDHLLGIGTSIACFSQTFLDASPRIAWNGAQAGVIGVLVLGCITTSYLNGMKTVEAIVWHSCEANRDILCRFTAPNVAVIIGTQDKGQG